MKLFSKKTVVKTVETKEQRIEREVANTKMALATQDRRRQQHQLSEIAQEARKNDEIWAGRR